MRPTSYTSDWISVGGEAMFAPLNLLEVVETPLAGPQPDVTEANVRSLDLANGGGYGGRLAGPPRPPSARSAPTRPAGPPWPPCSPAAPTAIR